MHYCVSMTTDLQNALLDFEEGTIGIKADDDGIVIDVRDHDGNDIDSFWLTYSELGCAGLKVSSYDSVVFRPLTDGDYATVAVSTASVFVFLNGAEAGVQVRDSAERIVVDTSYPKIAFKAQPPTWGRPGLAP